jgi:hypothetical protein
MQRFEVKVLTPEGKVVSFFIAASSANRAAWLAGEYGTVLPKNGKYRIEQPTPTVEE